MGTQAVLVAIVLSVCHGDGQQYSAQKCHYAFLSEPRVCTEYLKPAVCSNGGVISITSIQYEDENLNIPLIPSSCCLEIDGDVSTEIKENLYKECNNKSSCKFDSVKSGTLKIQYTCTGIQTSARTVTTSSATATSTKTTATTSSATATSTKTTATTSSMTAEVFGDITTTNLNVNNCPPAGLDPQITVAIIAGAVATCVIASVAIYIVGKRMKLNKDRSPTVTYNQETKSHVYQPNDMQPYEDLRRSNIYINEKAEEYTTLQFK